MATASPTRGILSESRLTRPTSPHEAASDCESNPTFAWPSTDAMNNDSSATASTSQGNKSSSDATADRSGRDSKRDERPKGRRQSFQENPRPSDTPDGTNGCSSFGSSTESYSRTARMDNPTQAADRRITGTSSESHAEKHVEYSASSNVVAREDPPQSSKSSGQFIARGPSSIPGKARNISERRTDGSKSQSSGKRIAAANDKLRRDRAKGSTDALKASSPGPNTGSDTGRQRNSHGRPDPAAMVIPPFRSKSTTTTPQASPKETTPSRVDAMRECPPLAKEFGTDLTTTTDFISSNRQGFSMHRRGSTGEDIAEATLLDAQPPSKWPTTTAAEHAVSHPSSLLCFHARNVPSIGVETYLQRILKYCPVTNDVFISLLVYFDRMSRKLASQTAELGRSEPNESNLSGIEPKGFAIDSYNVHRLVIAGITISSKFHSDVFYTNSRYAKVGGLPQTELNQLELQFLLLNDFNLMIPLDEMQHYADRLLIYGRDGSGELP